MLKGFIVRLHPTKEQEDLLWKHVNLSRFVYNWGLELRKKTYEKSGETLNNMALSRELTKFKKTPEGSKLNEVCSSTLVGALKDLEAAYIRFFREKTGFPKFKCISRSKKSFYARHDRTYFKSDVHLILPKIGKVKYKSSYNLPTGRLANKMLNPRVTLKNGKWILSFSIEVASTEKPKLNDFCCGIDLGVKTLITVSAGENELQIRNINKDQKVKRYQKWLKRVQRKHSKTKKGSKRREKARERMGKKYNRISNIRHNHIHQATRKIVNLHPKKIILEDLNVTGMLKNRHLSRVVSECNFAEIRRQLVYKAEEYGIEIVIADRFYPSSKKCSSCGSYKKDLKLSDRTYNCNSCNVSIDRDFNASRNLEKYQTKDSLILK